MQSRAQHVSVARKGERGGSQEVYSPPVPQIPRAQVFLNFILGIWSGADVRIVLSAAIAATALRGSRVPRRACFCA